MLVSKYQGVPFVLISHDCDFLDPIVDETSIEIRALTNNIGRLCPLAITRATKLAQQTAISATTKDFIYKIYRLLSQRLKPNSNKAKGRALSRMELIALA